MERVSDMKKILSFAAAWSCLLLLGACGDDMPAGSGNPPRPNIIVILADDMGFSDLGSYGSEIETPNLDRLAENGLRMTQFYNTARCSPTRASLLTGLYPQQAGVAQLDGNLGAPAYQGYLDESTVTVAEVLREAGYKSYLAGKWHVGREEGQWPMDRGFDRYYGLVEGASSYYTNIDYRDPNGEERRVFGEGNEPIDLPRVTEEEWRRNEGYHMTNAFTDHALEFLEQHDREAPFFLYLAYTAPHWPLHAFPKDIQKYQGTYDIGWDSLRALRFENQRELGLFEDDVVLAPTSDRVASWEEAEASRKEAWQVEMTLYAAVVHHMDRQIGRVIDRLEKNGELDNTLILFLSDNGGCHTTPQYDHLDGAPGGPNSFPTYGYEGAEVSNVPFRLWKQFIHQGGISSPFIAHYPDMISPGVINRENAAHAIDLMPTFIELAGAEYPEERNGHPVTPMEGVSLVPVFQGETFERNGPLYFAHQGNRGIRSGDWKAVSARMDRQWELYNVADDPTELNDLSEEFPEVRQELVGKYESWADEVNVLPWDDLQDRIREYWSSGGR